MLLDAAAAGGGIQALGVNVLLGQIESSLGVDLREDMLAWMGAGGLFVRGTDKGEVSGALVIKSKDPAAMRRAVRKLRSATGGLPAGAAARPFQAPGIDEGALLTLGSLRLELAAAGDRFVIAIGPGALEEALDPGEELGDTAKFKAAQERLGDDLKAGLYVDMPQLADLLERSGDGQGGAVLAGVLRNMSQLVAGGTQDGDVSRVRSSWRRACRAPRELSAGRRASRRRPAASRPARAAARRRAGSSAPRAARSPGCAAPARRAMPRPARRRRPRAVPRAARCAAAPATSARTSGTGQRAHSARSACSRGRPSSIAASVARSSAASRPSSRAAASASARSGPRPASEPSRRRSRSSGA